MCGFIRRLELQTNRGIIQRLMQKSDPYANPDRQADATVQAMITRLEERGQHPEFLRMIADYLGTLPQDRPLKALDLGCGTGVVTRRLRAHLHPGSTVHGADISERLLDTARSLSPTAAIAWDKLDSTSLPYGDASFDVVIMHTVLSHVPQPQTLLREASRVLAGRGRLIIFDADHASTTYGLPDYAAMRETDFKLATAIATHPDICRQLPRYLKAAGFKLENHRSAILSECGCGDYWLSSVRGLARMIPALGILSPSEAEAWVSHQMKSHEEGTFFAAGAFYTFHALRDGE